MKNDSKMNKSMRGSTCCPSRSLMWSWILDHASGLASTSPEPTASDTRSAPPSPRQSCWNGSSSFPTYWQSDHIFYLNLTTLTICWIVQHLYISEYPNKEEKWSQRLHIKFGLQLSSFISLVLWKKEKETYRSHQHTYYCN